MANERLSEEKGVTVTLDGEICVDGWAVYVSTDNYYNPTAYLEGEEPPNAVGKPTKVLVDGTGSLYRIEGVPDGAVLLAVARLAFRMGFEAGGGAVLEEGELALDRLSAGLPR